MEVNEDNEVRSAVQIQQEYFENVPACDWIKYEKADRHYLLQNVAFALFGSPTRDGDLTVTDALQGYTSRQEEQATKVFMKLCKQSKYSKNNEDIVMSVLLVVCAKPKSKIFKSKKDWVDLHQRTDVEITHTPVFKVRKCIPICDGAKSCSVYIDEDARVYQSWESYLTDNTQPKCVLILPQDGEYTGEFIQDDQHLAVKLSVVPSPALGFKSIVLSSADTASTVASLGAIAVFGAAALTPIGPAVMAGAVVTTAATGLYGLVRSSIQLHDRRMHKQTISPTDAEARGCWLNITMSSVGLVGGAASGLLAKSTAAGNNMTKTGKVLAMSVKVLRPANLVAGGAAVVNSIVQIVLKYKKHGEPPTQLEVFQLTAAMLFFCNAALSNRAAKQIIEEAPTGTLEQFRQEPRSVRLRLGEALDNTENVQGISNIADQQQFYEKVLRPFPAQPVSSTNIAGDTSGNFLFSIAPGAMITVGKFVVRMTASGAANIAKMLEGLSEEAYLKIQTVVCELICNFLPAELAKLRCMSPYGDFILLIVRFVFKYLRDKIPNKSKDDSCIVLALKEFFKEGRVRAETIVLLKDRLMAWVEEKISSLQRKETICYLCNNVRFS